MSSLGVIVHLDLNFNELQNALIQNLATLPTFTAGTNAGFVCFHTANNRMMLWTGSSWINLSDVYEHPLFPGTGQPATALTGAQVISRITLDNGHITGITTRNLTAADISAANVTHTHLFSDIIGLPTQTIMGNKTGTTGPAQALSVADVLLMLGIAYGNIGFLNGGTDTQQRTWSSETLNTWLTAKLAGYVVTVDLSLGPRTATTMDIINSAGTDVTLPSATPTQAGLQSGADKTKLDGIAPGANYYVHSTLNPGAHPFATEQTSGVQIVSQIVVNNEGHVITIKGRDLTTADIAAIMIDNNLNNSTNKTWSSSKIYTEIQSAIGQAQTGALQYKGEYNPATNTPDLTSVGLGVKTGWTYVVNASGTFAGQSVEAGDMIIAKTDNPGSTNNNWQIVNKNIPAIVSASTIAEGIIMLATIAEALQGTNNTKAITPYTLKAVLDATVGGMSVLLGDTSTIDFTVSHSFNTRDLTLQLQRVSDGKYFWADVYSETLTTVRAKFNRPPSNSEYKLIIKK